MDPNRNGLQRNFDYQFSLFKTGMDPHKNGVADAFDPKKNGFNKFVNDVEDKGLNFLDKLFGGDAMNKILLVVGGVALIMVMKKS